MRNRLSEQEEQAPVCHQHTGTGWLECEKEAEMQNQLRAAMETLMSLHRIHDGGLLQEPSQMVACLRCGPRFTT